MICRILLLIILNSCLCAATFVVNVTQSSYQAEENHNITLEWTFTTTPGSFPSSLFIYCDFSKDQQQSVIFHVFKGLEASLHLDKKFSGRVQSDKDVLKDGRIRLHVSRLRTEDSGLYKCQVNTDYGQGSASLQLNVTEAPAKRKTVGTEPESRGRTYNPAWIFVTLGLVVFICAIVCLVERRTRPRRLKRQHIFRSMILQDFQLV